MPAVVAASFRPQIRRVRTLPTRGPLRHWRARALWQRVQPDLATRLASKLASRPRLQFAQVGSNDGVTGDPLRAHILNQPDWRGVLIEPLPFLFDRLEANYSHGEIDPAIRRRVALEAVAIADQAGEQTFYHVDPEAMRRLDLPWHFDQLGSFDREHVTKHLPAHAAEAVAETRVRCEPLAAVLDRHGLDRLDLLHVDAEGYDASVIEQVDFDAHPLPIVMFEHRNLSAERRDATYRLLASHGYRLHADVNDCLALRAA